MSRFFNIQYYRVLNAEKVHHSTVIVELDDMGEAKQYAKDSHPNLMHHITESSEQEYLLFQDEVLNTH